MQEPTKQAANRRLARINGQLRGVGVMIEDNRYCIDVVRQIQAIRAALKGLEHVVLDDHLSSCVDHALRSDDLSDRREKVEELVAILGGRKK